MNRNQLITKIVGRADALSKANGYQLDTSKFRVEITLAVEKNDLDLERLLGFPDSSFGHDVYGIIKHMDMGTGELDGIRFWPRCGAVSKEDL